MSNYFCLCYFSGIGGFSLGAKSLGIETLGVEWIPELGELYQENVGECLIADIATLNPYKIDLPDTKLIFQISPPCPDFSMANMNRDPLSDRANLLDHCFDHTLVFDPDIIILENVRGYQTAPVYKKYLNFLKFHGYDIKDWILNAANFGVPQSRQRLIMIAVKAGEPMPIIRGTHTKENWIGWYEAIADLIEDLPESKLTENQEAAIYSRLNYPENYKNNTDNLAYLISGKNNSSNGYKRAVQSSAPSFTISASEYKAFPRLIQRVGYYNGKPQIKLAHEPCWTLKAELADDKKGGSRSKIIDCIVNSDVRSLDVKSLARLQSFPDWYKFSGKNSVDVRGLGNSVPSLLSREILKSVLAAGQMNLL